MKKHVSIILISVLMLSMLAIAGCNNGNGGSGSSTEPEEGAEYDTSLMLQQIMDSVKANVPEGVFIPMTMNIEVNGDNSKGYIGLETDKFGELVIDAHVAMAGITSQAFLVALIKCNDNSSAEVKNLIGRKEGFDSGRWICVFPDVSIVVECGRFVLLAAVPEAAVDTVVSELGKQFQNTSVGSVLKFYEKGDEGEVIPFTEESN